MKSDRQRTEKGNPRYTQSMLIAAIANEGILLIMLPVLDRMTGEKAGGVILYFLGVFPVQVLICIAAVASLPAGLRIASRAHDSALVNRLRALGVIFAILLLPLAYMFTHGRL